MKKIVFILLLLSIIGNPVMSHADTAVKKLGRGLANIGTCYFEIPHSMGNANNESGPVAAITVGVVEGLLKTCVRAIIGVYEVATFPIPLPRDYAPILTEPEFFLEDGIF